MKHLIICIFFIYLIFLTRFHFENLKIKEYEIPLWEVWQECTTKDEETSLK